MSKAIRDAYGEVSLLKYGKDNQEMKGQMQMYPVSTKFKDIWRVLSERFFNVGIAESNMVSMAAGYQLQVRYHL